MKKYLIVKKQGSKKKFLREFGYGSIQYTPQAELAMYFNNECDAKKIIDYKIKEIENKIIDYNDSAEECIGLAAWFKTLDVAKKDFYIKKHKIWYRDGESNETWNELAKSYSARSIGLKQYLNNLKNVTIESIDIGIKFLKSKKKDIKWLDTPDHGGKIYCNVCGAAVPNMKYLYIPGGYNNSSKHICAFCVGGLAKQVEKILNEIDDEVKKQYKSDGFMNNL